MRKIRTGLALAVALSTAALGAQKTETLKVSGWHCAGCTAKTETALKELQGVQSASTDRASSQVKVTYDDAKVSHAAIEKAITDAGFTVGRN